VLAFNYNTADTNTVQIVLSISNNLFDPPMIHSNAIMIRNSLKKGPKSRK
jgi:hypothetical protein